MTNENAIKVFYNESSKRIIGMAEAESGQPDKIYGWEYMDGLNSRDKRQSEQTNADDQDLQNTQNEQNVKESHNMKRTKNNIYDDFEEITDGDDLPF